MPREVDVLHSLKLQTSLDLIQRTRSWLLGARFEKCHQFLIAAALREFVIKLIDRNEKKLASVGETHNHIIIARLIKQIEDFAGILVYVNGFHNSYFFPRIYTSLPTFSPTAITLTIRSVKLTS